MGLIVILLETPKSMLNSNEVQIVLGKIKLKRNKIVEKCC